MTKEQTKERKAARAAKNAARQYAATEVFLDALMSLLKKDSDTNSDRKAS